MINQKENYKSSLDQTLIAANYYAKHKQFWAQELNNIETMDYLYKDEPAHEVSDGQGYQHTALDHSDTLTLSGFTRGNKKALSILSLACLNLFLNRYTDQTDIVIGMVESDENGIPYQFIMRNDIKNEMKFKEFLFQVKDNYLKVSPYKKMPMYILNQILGTVMEEEPEGLSCQVMLVCDPQVDTSKLKQELIFLVEEQAGDIMAAIRYQKRYFCADTIRRYLHNFSYLLSRAVEQMDTEAGKVDILCMEEKQDIYNNFNATSRNFEPLQTIVSLFDDQVKQKPQETALICGESQVSYQKLKDMSEKIASCLQVSGVEEGTTVGILLERSIELIAGLLGILRAGAAYLPLDPNYPHSRITYMLQDSGACTLLSRAEYAKDLDCGFIDIHKALEESEIKAFNSADCSAASYIIYTSGSTGLPKGVVIEHRSVYNFIKAMEEAEVFGQLKNVLSLTTVCFDIFVLESWGSLSLGKTVILAAEEAQRDPNLICNLISKEEVELLQATPSRIHSLMQCKKGPEAFRRLKSILIGGEPFPGDFIRFMKCHQIRSRIYNVYGPTETTVWSTIKRITPDFKSINIGKPIANTQVYIVGQQMENLPVLAAGELCIGGSGLARGYQGKEALTKERFVKLPVTGKYVYRTGDYARINNRGEIEFIGRRDSQIKVRGYRIELEEIESHLKDIEGIRESAAAIQKDKNGNSILCAYCVLERPMDPKYIRKRLGTVIPEYMVPNFIYEIDSLPYTLNQKLDRKMLPQIGKLLISPENLNNVKKVKNFSEEKLHEIFCRVLNLEEVGLEEDFFDIGGHSLNTIQLEVECEKEGIPLTVADIFKFRTIQALSDYLINKEHMEQNKLNFQPNQKGFVELEGVVPFEKIFYKNCFYNCLFSVITYYGKLPSNVLTSEYLRYDTDSTKENLNITVRYVNEKLILDKLREIGLVLYEENHTEDIIEAVKTAIQSGDPVILRVDPFYEPMRKDAYNKLHLPHAWVVYGFDENTQTFRILEHMHKDDTRYRPLTIKYEDAAACHEGYIKNGFMSHEPDLYRFRAAKEAISGEGLPSDEYCKLLKKNKTVIEEGLLKLEKIAEKPEIIQDSNRIELEQKILASMNDIVNSKGVELYKLKCYFGEGKISRLGETILELWHSVRAVMYKNILTRKENSLLILIQKIPVIVEAERELLEQLTQL